MQFDVIEQKLVAWADNVDAKEKEEVEKYFDELFDKYKELREYINNYTFAIPVVLFSGYQSKLITFTDSFSKIKD